MKKLRLLFLTVITTVFLSLTTLVSATFTNDFTKTIHSTYTVEPDGSTKVVHNIKIKNNTPTTYLKQYALKTSYSGLSNVKVVDKNNQELKANITNDGSGTLVAITFTDQLVGQGKVREFSIEYDNHDLANIVGKVLEVHIPKLGDNNSFNTNQVTLITPAIFALPVKVVPQPQTSNFEQTILKQTFERENGEDISAIFGKEQTYTLTLRYNLENPTNSPALTQIALPPDTSFQQLHYHSLDPLFSSIKKDLDGNWIATYKLPANSATTVHLTAQAKITLEANGTPVNKPSGVHTQSLKFWESDQAEIKEKASLYRTPTNIYHFVVNSLSYSQETSNLINIPRLGAAETLKKPHLATCQEFSDLFIALARANQLPARRLVGYAYTTNSSLRPLSFSKDILHAWPEYYSTEKQIWLQTDPTWGNTTGGIDYLNSFDLNHIAFVINGTSSSLPHPAGSYKLENEDTKDVEVAVSENFPHVPLKITTHLQTKKLLMIPIPGIYELTITNDTGRAWYDINLEVTSENNTQVNIDQSSIHSLLPFQTIKKDIVFINDSKVINQDQVSFKYFDKQNLQLLYESKPQTVTTTNSFIKQLQQKNTILILAISAIFLTLFIGSLLVFKRKK